jgi:hypothetical protein
MYNALETRLQKHAQTHTSGELMHTGGKYSLVSV